MKMISYKTAIISIFENLKPVAVLNKSVKPHGGAVITNSINLEKGLKLLKDRTAKLLQNPTGATFTEFIDINLKLLNTIFKDFKKHRYEYDNYVNNFINPLRHMQYNIGEVQLLKGLKKEEVKKLKELKHCATILEFYFDFANDIFISSNDLNSYDNIAHLMPPRLNFLISMLKRDLIIMLQNSRKKNMKEYA